MPHACTNLSLIQIIGCMQFLYIHVAQPPLNESLAGSDHRVWSGRVGECEKDNNGMNGEE